MRKVFGCLLVMALLTAAPAAVSAQTNPVEDLTGKVWMESKQDNKLALLYGVDCAIVIEHYVDQAMKKKKAKGYTLSPFEKGWSKAFKDVSREQLVNEIDAWYKEHPDQLEKPVFEVIWYNMIAPKLQ